eukprot:3883398-Rhodomonas_salina.3
MHNKKSARNPTGKCCNASVTGGWDSSVQIGGLFLVQSGGEFSRASVTATILGELYQIDHYQERGSQRGWVVNPSCKMESEAEIKAKYKEVSSRLSHAGHNKRCTSHGWSSTVLVAHETLDWCGSGNMCRTITISRSLR